MLQKKFTKKRILCTGITMVVSATILAGAISNRYSLYARPTLPGIETYIDQNSPNTPMVLVEVVPDKSVARLGYLVAGDEPVDNSGKSIHDMPAKNEREVRFSNTKTVPVNLERAVYKWSCIYSLGSSSKGRASINLSKSLWNKRSCMIRYLSNPVSACSFACSADTWPVACRTASDISCHWIQLPRKSR